MRLENKPSSEPLHISGEGVRPAHQLKGSELRDGHVGRRMLHSGVLSLESPGFRKWARPKAGPFQGRQATEVISFGVSKASGGDVWRRKKTRLLGLLAFWPDHFGPFRVEGFSV